jgi:hypothetical protein
MMRDQLSRFQAIMQGWLHQSLAMCGNSFKREYERRQS